MCVRVCMHACVCACVCVRACVCVCMHACVCVAKPVTVELRCHATALIFSFMDSFVFKQVLLRVDFLSVTLDHSVQYPRLGLGVKIKEILKNHFFFLFLLCNQSYLKKR